MFGDAWAGPVAGPLLFALPLLLSGCEEVRINGGPGPVTDAGFVELDENTEPRFVHYNREGPIATLRVSGNNVFVDGIRVRETRHLLNNARVTTGPESGARIDLLGGTPYRCRIGILDFRAGRLFGDTRTCPHQVETSQGTARADTTPAEYHAAIVDRGTEVTVIRGTMTAWLWRDPSRTVTIGSMEQAVLTPISIDGPWPVSRDYVFELTAWRRKFDFSEEDARGATCERYARMAVAQNEENLRRRCGYTGARWQSDFRGHYEWCMAGSNHRLAERENAARDRELRRCGEPMGDNVAFCRSYAERAVAQNQENLKRRCGYTGVSWQSDFGAHYRWCLEGNHAGIAQRETDMRDRQLAQCRRPPAESPGQGLAPLLRVLEGVLRQRPADRDSTPPEQPDVPVVR